MSKSRIRTVGLALALIVMSGYCLAEETRSEPKKKLTVQEQFERLKRRSTLKKLEEQQKRANQAAEPKKGGREFTKEQYLKLRQMAEQGSKAAAELLPKVETRFAELGREAEVANWKVEAEAQKRVRKQAEQGDAEAQFELGQMYCHSVPKDCREGMKWYLKAAVQGHAEAHNAVGWSYRWGIGGVPEDNREAVRWFRKAVEKGVASASTLLLFTYRDLGDMYYSPPSPDDISQGKGVSPDYREAFKWYRLAAELKGIHIDQFRLGLMYYNGEGVPKNDREAIKWFRKAAEQGHASAQHNMGYMYYNGYGVTKNHVRAYAWMSLAAAQGAEDSAKTRDEIATEMTPEQIAEAQKLAAELYERIEASKSE